MPISDFPFTEAWHRTTPLQSSIFVMTRNKMTNSHVHFLTVELRTIDILDEYWFINEKDRDQISIRFRKQLLTLQASMSQQYYSQECLESHAASSGMIESGRSRIFTILKGREIASRLLNTWFPIVLHMIQHLANIPSMLRIDAMRIQAFIHNQVLHVWKTQTFRKANLLHVSRIWKSRRWKFPGLPNKEIFVIWLMSKESDKILSWLLSFFPGVPLQDAIAVNV
jgi:hypothetical protein